MIESKPPQHTHTHTHPLCQTPRRWTLPWNPRGEALAAKPMPRLLTLHHMVPGIELSYSGFAALAFTHWAIPSAKLFLQLLVYICVVSEFERTFKFSLLHKQKFKFQETKPLVPKERVGETTSWSSSPSSCYLFWHCVSLFPCHETTPSASHRHLQEAGSFYVRAASLEKW